MDCDATYSVPLQKGRLLTSERLDLLQCFPVMPLRCVLKYQACA